MIQNEMIVFKEGNRLCLQINGENTIYEIRQKNYETTREFHHLLQKRFLSCYKGSVIRVRKETKSLRLLLHLFGDEGKERGYVLEMEKEFIIYVPSSVTTTNISVLGPSLKIVENVYHYLSHRMATL